MPDGWSIRLIWREKMSSKMYQVSTLQALALGYTRAVITIEELVKHGNTGLGTFENVDGEMILMDGKCFRAMEDGTVVEEGKDTGVPFCAIADLNKKRTFDISDVPNMDALRELLTLKIEEDFGLNSMHVVRIDGIFGKIDARSEAPFRSQNVTLQTILSKNQRAFVFENIRGSLVGVYFPDYMDGINMPGWHLHFISEDRSKGGHVFDMSLQEGTVYLDKISRIEIQLPTEAAFDTYSLKQASEDEIKKVEKG